LNLRHAGNSAAEPVVSGGAVKAIARHGMTQIKIGAPETRYLIALQIFTADAAWIILGATLGRGARRLGRPDLVTRAGGVTLVVVTGLIWLQSFLMA
jgi:hypothetical protein